MNHPIKPPLPAIAKLWDHLCAKHGWQKGELDVTATMASLTILHQHEHDVRLTGPAPNHTIDDLRT